jgi:prepilin-type N-terminal cleavage/methylation domain-containing protein
MRIALRAVRGRRATARDDSGMTIIELLVAIVVFAVVASGVAVAMGSSLDLARNNRNRSVSANLASLEMDKVRSADFTTLAPGLVTSTRIVDGVGYTIERDSEWVSQNATTGACDSPSGSKPAYLRVTVEVRWPNMSGARPVTSQTILTPPVGAYDPNSGHIAVKVVDSTGGPASGHLVTVSGPGGVKTQTTADGCAFFAYLAAGSYTVSLGTTGYVDRQGDNTPQQTAGVTVGTIKSLQFDYDQAATLELTLGQDPAYPLPDGFPVTIANTSLLPTGSRVVTGTGSARTIPNLFPYADGYRVWVGDCGDNDPEGVDDTGTPYHSGDVRQVIATPPGQTVSATINVKRLDVRSVDSINSPVTGAVVRAAHEPDDQCGGYDVTLGTTGPLLNSVQASLPYGRWTITSDTSGQTKNLSPSGPDPEVVTVVK